MPKTTTRHTPNADNPSESPRRASDGTSSRDIMIRKLPEDAYETLRLRAFEQRKTYGEIIAEALAKS